MREFHPSRLDALQASGLLPRETWEALRATRSDAPEKTWAELLEGAGLSGASLAEGLRLTEPQEHSPRQELTEGYRYIEELGAGAMGRVELVEDPRLHRKVARKTLLHHQPGLAVRFLREARVTAQLEHPGIVPVYELGRMEDGSPYYVMRRVRWPG